MVGGRLLADVMPRITKDRLATSRGTRRTVGAFGVRVRAHSRAWNRVRLRARLRVRVRARARVRGRARVRVGVRVRVRV